jgi:aspartyl-tRNA(Asn)/glutamyl-tRNA(Gln) amidotransferase subunit C
MLDAAALKKLAELSRITVPDDELEALGGELSAILNFVDEINSVDVAVAATVESEHRNIARHDDVSVLESAYDLVEAAPRHQDNFVKVPKVIGE